MSNNGRDADKNSSSSIKTSEKNTRSDNGRSNLSDENIRAGKYTTESIKPNKMIDSAGNSIDIRPASCAVESVRADSDRSGKRSGVSKSGGNDRLDKRGGNHSSDKASGNDSLSKDGRNDSSDKRGGKDNLDKRSVNDSSNKTVGKGCSDKTVGKDSADKKVGKDSSDKSNSNSVKFNVVFGNNNKSCGGGSSNNNTFSKCNDGDNNKGTKRIANSSEIIANGSQRSSNDSCRKSVGAIGIRNDGPSSTGSGIMAARVSVPPNGNASSKVVNTGSAELQLGQKRAVGRAVGSPAEPASNVSAGNLPARVAPPVQVSVVQIFSIFVTEGKVYIGVSPGNFYQASQGILNGKYHCTIDLLFDWFGISCMTTDNFLQNRQIQTSHTGGQ